MDRSVEENLRAEFVDRSEILLVSLPGPPTPDRVVIVRKVVEAYMALVAERYDSIVRRRLDRLRLIRDDFRERVEAARVRLAERGRAAGASALRREVLRGEMEHAAREAIRVKLEAAEVDARLESLKASGAGEATAVLEGRRAALARQGEALEHEAGRLEKEAQGLDASGPDLAGDREALCSLEETLSRLEEESNTMDVEMHAPKRIQIVDLPSVPRPARG